MAVSGRSSGPGSKSPVKILANIFISFIGAGVLGLPFAFKEAGIIEGTIVMSLVGIISVKAMLLLIHCKYRILEKHKPSRKSPEHQNGHFVSTADTEKLLEGEEKLTVDMEIVQVTNPPDTVTADLSYGDVGYHAIGPVGRLLVDVAIVVSQTGFCCAYIIFITENLSTFFPKVPLTVWLLILLPFLAMMTLPRHLGALAMTSLMAQCSNLFAFAVVLWFDLEHLHNIEVHPKKMKLGGLPFFLAISIYCYEGAGMILSLEASVAEGIRHKFKRYFVSTMLIVTCMYVAFGSCGYASFGKETNPIITLNLPHGSSLDFSMVVKSCLCLALFFTYPVMMFPVMAILDGYLIWEPEKNILKGNLLRVSLVLMTGIVVLMIPSFSNIMALVGATCCTLLAFILPGLFHMTIFKGSLTKFQLSLDWLLIGVGIIGAVVGTLDALARMNEDHKPMQPVIKMAMWNITSTTSSPSSSTMS